MPERTCTDLVLFRPGKSTGSSAGRSSMPILKGHVRIVDADGNPQPGVSSVSRPPSRQERRSSSSQSTTNPAPRYRPLQAAAGSGAPPRSSSYHRPSVKGKEPSAYRWHHRRPKSGRNRDDSPGIGPSRQPIWNQESSQPNEKMHSSPNNPTYGSYDFTSGAYRRPKFHENVPGMVPYGYHPPGPFVDSYSAMPAGAFGMPPPPVEPAHMLYMSSQALPTVPGPPPPPAPSSSPSPDKKRESEEIENLRRELAKVKEDQRAREERQRQEEFEKRVQEEAEKNMKMRMEEIRLAQKAARKELEEAKAEIEKAAREAIEAERQAEEQRRVQEREELEECQRIARGKLEAELRARAEWEQQKEQEAHRLRMDAEAKVEAKLAHEQEERRRIQEEEEEKERVRQQIRDEVRLEFMKRERRYMSSSSETESFSSRSSLSSSYLSLSTTSRSRSTSSKVSARLKAPSCSSCRATKALSIGSSDDFKVLNLQTSDHGAAGPTREDDATENGTLDPFMYLEKASTPPPPNLLRNDIQTQELYWDWEHYSSRLPSGFIPEDAGYTYADLENQAIQEGQQLSFAPDDDESGSSSSSGTDSDDNGSSLGIGGIFEHEASDDESSDAGTVIAASDRARLTPSVMRDDGTRSKGKEVLPAQGTQAERLSKFEVESPYCGNSRFPSTENSEQNRPKTQELPLKFPAQEESTLPAALVQYLITDGNEEQQQVSVEKFPGEIDTGDGGANLISHPKQLAMSKAVPERTKNAVLTDRPSGGDSLRSHSSRDSPLLPLLAKHISDFEEESSQRNRSSNSCRVPLQSQNMKSPDGSFRPFLQEGNCPNWAGEEKPNFLFPYYLGNQGSRSTSSFDLGQIRSTRASSSVSSEYETEVPMALVPCIMVPLNMIQSAMQGPMFYQGAMPRQDR
ncbi:hypothetical protein CKAH01_02257 [Colletotrichum kahawae]|uniref:Reticulocyte-binding protein 2-like protein a n=1 Tax=Colletotrichum kahawae TaxID=34407 RepID=A0AAD9Y2M5_COLKA|nr:hypothetical protein CKAH01_02257 [Colletotrichum kahawae]